MPAGQLDTRYCKRNSYVSCARCSRRALWHYTDGDLFFCNTHFNQWQENHEFDPDFVNRLSDDEHMFDRPWGKHVAATA